MYKLAAQLTTATHTMQELANAERGDGPTDNSILIAAGVVGGLLLTGAAAALISQKVGQIK